MIQDKTKYTQDLKQFKADDMNKCGNLTLAPD